MKQILEERDDIVFFIKLLPLKIHPAAYNKAKAIVCEKSVKLLERAFDGWTIPDPSCETTEVDDTMELAERLGITGTPAIILPDGAVIKGFKDAASLQRLIEQAGQAAETVETEGASPGDVEVIEEDGLKSIGGESDEGGASEGEAPAKTQ